MRQLFGVFISAGLAAVLIGCSTAPPATQAPPAPTEGLPAAVAAFSPTSAPASTEAASAPTEQTAPTEQAAPSVQVAPTVQATPPYPTPNPNPICVATPLTVDAKVPPVGEGDWIKGPADAAVTMIEYGDFQ